MGKTNKNLTKKILTLMLAFVMVFTGMGIGSWGVDTAWADGSFDLDMSSASVIGNVTLNNVKYPLYYISVDGSTYDTVQMLKGSGTIDINGAKKQFPTTAFCADSSGGIGSLPVNIVYNDTNYINAKTYYGVKKDDIEITDTTHPLTTEDSKLLFRLRYGTGKNAKNCAYLILTWSAVTSADTTKLTTLINSIPSSGYYTNDDHYNGKTVSATGFWKDMQSALTTAKGLFADEALTSLKTGVSQSQVNKAKEDLESAIANLIPKTQLNATYLYETVQSQGNYPEEYLEACTDVSAAAYREIAEKAKAYLKLLFDEEKSEEYPEGAMKTVNVPANQGVADGYADELKNFRFLFKEDITNATWNLKTINALAKQYDMTENNGKYTEESWKTFVSARKAATEYAQQHPISNSMKSAEAQEYAKLARAFQSAAYGLTSKKETVTVTFSYTDDYHLREADRKESVAYRSLMTDPEGNQAKKQTVKLTSGATLAELWNQTGYTTRSSFYGNYSYSMWRTLVNGRMLNGYTPGVQQYFADTNYVLKDGDEIQLVHMDWPTFVFNYIYRDDVKWDKMADILGILRFAESEEGSQNAAAGEDINLTLERTSAHPWSYTGSYSAYEGATLAVYGPMNDDGSYPQTPILSEKTSDADGKVSIKLYKPGKYLVTAYDARENNEDASLFYSGTVAAPYMELTVADAGDTSKVRAELKKELDKVYNACKSLDLNYDGTKKDKDGKPEPEYFTKEEKSQINKAYEDAAQVLGSSKSTAVLRG